VTSTARLLALAPAKVNLSLKVLGRREDGYHELDTVFQTVDLWDRLAVCPGEGLSLECDRPGIPSDGTNLVLRAAKMLRERCGRPDLGAHFELHKSIPAGGGLGGGSSDAAAALRLAASHWGLEVSRDTQLDLARRLGADVPFFLYGGTARGLGRGDRIEPLEPLPETPLLLGLPPFGISTAEVFSRLRARLTLPENGVNLHDPLAYKVPIGKDFRLAANDLEEVVFRDWPELSTFRDGLLDAGAERAMLSGSGSTVFGMFDNEVAMRGAVERLGATFGGWQLIPTRTVREAIRWVDSNRE